MQLLRLVLNNFKRFSEAQFDFCPGINLVWGRNESGKSTLHEAICTALFGRERGKVVESWVGGACSVELLYRTKGKVFKLERRLTEGRLLIAEMNGEEPGEAITSKEDITGILADHLGISSRAVFDNTISIRQLHVSRINSADMETVSGEIQRVLTGTAHVSAAEVLRRLETDRDAVRGRPRPTNPREYDHVTVRLRELAEDLADARRSRQHILNLEEEQAQLESRIEQGSVRLDTVSRLLERHRQWSELKRRESELGEVHSGVFATTRQIRETLDKLKQVEKELEGFADLVGRDDEIADHLGKLESRRCELEARLEGLEVAGDDLESYSMLSRHPVLLYVALLLTALGAAAGLFMLEAGLLLLVPGLLLGGLHFLLRRTGGRPALSNIFSLTDSTRRELGQIESEEAGMLSFIKCRSADEAWARIKTYRGLVSRAHELEVTLTALLGGRTLADWEAQESGLARELSAVCAQLNADFPGYSPSAEEVESWRSECSALHQSLPTAESRLNTVMGSLEAERRNARDVAALEGEIEYLHRRKAELEFLHQAYQEAISTLMLVTKSVSEEYLPRLCERASDLMSRVTDGRYASIDVKPGWEISVDCPGRNGTEPADLSIGAQDQLYLSLRIACGELLSSGRRLPIILDDPFASYDRPRLDNTLRLLETVTRENQVLLLTHDPHILEWAHRLLDTGDSPCKIHELPSP